MKKFTLIITVLVVMVGLAGVDYWFNFKGKGPLFPPTQNLSPAALEPDLVEQGVPQGQTPEVVTPAASDFSGSFPLLLAAGSAQFPYTIASQQRVFDLFGIFNLNALPGLQVLRYDVVPANSDPALKPVQVYELRQASQSAGITFLSLSSYLSTQVDPVNELNKVGVDYAANALFYNPVIPSENAFLLAENGILLGFVYPKNSTQTFQALKNFLQNMPENLATLGSPV